jgi:hypothetical protein
MATNVKTNAKTKDEVDQMSAKDRMWDSLSYSYGKKKEESDRSYDKAISQQDRALLQRGMQRSSYGMNTLGNLQNQKVNAGNDINSQLIADYENRLYQLDRDEIEDAFRQQQFDETKRQFDENLGFQKSEAERAQGNWQKEYDANRADTTWSQNFQQAQADIQNEQWNKNFEAGREDAQWNKDIQREELDFKKEQWEKQQEQWREEFDYQKMSDRQKLLFSYIETALQNGKDVSDALLAEVGMTRADFNAMVAEAVKSGYGGSYGGKKDTSDNSAPASNKNLTTGGLIDAMDMYKMPSGSETVGAASGGATGYGSTSSKPVTYSGTPNAPRQSGTINFKTVSGLTKTGTFTGPITNNPNIKIVKNDER